MIVFKVLTSVFSICIICVIYQLLRNNAVFFIRSKWTNKRDTRWYTYTYDEMFEPCKKNWYGFKYPRDKDFK